MMFNSLTLLKQQCETCSNCALHLTRTQTVFDCGVSNSKIMLIGEAPGYYEDQSGIPFVGKAGKLLDQILASQGFYRESNIYICNILKCRPPNNRDPLPEEQKACQPFLKAQIRIIRPRIILLCGRIALASFINTTLGISKVRGQWFNGPLGSKIMPIYHPSYLLRNPSHAPNSPKWQMWQDIKEIRRVYDSLD